MHRHPRIVRHVGDPVTVLIPVVGLEAGQVQAAVWTCAAVTKVKDDGIEVTTVAEAEASYPGFQRPHLRDGEPVADATVVLVVALAAGDTASIGQGVTVRPRDFEWQAQAGAASPPVVGAGVLRLRRRL